MANFPGSALGKPERSQRRIAEQGDTLSIDEQTTLRDFRQFGGPLEIELTGVPPLSYNSDGVPEIELPGKTNINPLAWNLGDLDPTNYGQLHFMANFFGKYTVTDNTTWRKWNFARDGATSAKEYLKLLDDDDVNPRRRFLNFKTLSFTVSNAVNGNYAMGVGGRAMRYDFSGDPVQTVGSGSTAPTILGARQEAFTDLGEEDIFVEIQLILAGTFDDLLVDNASAAIGDTSTPVDSVNGGTILKGDVVTFADATEHVVAADLTLAPAGSGTLTFAPAFTTAPADSSAVTGTTLTVRAKRGSVAAYSNTQIYRTPSVQGRVPRMRLEDEAGVELGNSYSEPIYFLLQNAATYTAADEWRIDHQRDRWTQSIAAKQAIPAVNTTVFIDDDEFRLNGGYTVTATWAELLSMEPGGRQGGVVLQDGLMSVEVTFTRLLTDGVFQAKQHNRDVVSVVIDSKSDTEITSGQPYVYRPVMPAALLTGAMYSTAEGLTGREENLVLKAGVPVTPYTFDGDTFASNFHVIAHNNFLTL